MSGDARDRAPDQLVNPKNFNAGPQLNFDDLRAGLNTQLMPDIVASTRARADGIAALLHEGRKMAFVVQAGAADNVMVFAKQRVGEKDVKPWPMSAQIDTVTAQVDLQNNKLQLSGTARDTIGSGAGHVDQKLALTLSTPLSAIVDAQNSIQNGVKPSLAGTESHLDNTLTANGRSLVVHADCSGAQRDECTGRVTDSASGKTKRYALSIKEDKGFSQIVVRDGNRPIGYVDVVQASDGLYAVHSKPLAPGEAIPQIGGDKQ